MKSKTTLTLVDGVRIIVPDSLDMVTTYVLREQEDWFEDEIKFLRCLLRPGAKVIDVGANYGVYTLPMARLVGPAGRVWSFEPASTTARFLAESIAANNFSQVILEQKALSSSGGVAQLSLHDNSEVNALVRNNAPAGETETVDLVSLDECLVDYGWEDIDFIKLDAEGEEAGIIRGGSRFFEVQSPLVQYEINAGAKLNMDLIRAFSELGYSSYRLVPGLNLLTPFNEEEPVDYFLLNLFCCKPDRAAGLAAMGFLVDKAVDVKMQAVRPTNPCRKPDTDQTNNWLATLEQLPYGQMCSGNWRKNVDTGQRSEVDTALLCYMLSRSTSLTAAERFSALEESFVRLRTLCATQSSCLRLASLARVAQEYGARTLAVKALGQLCDTIFQQRQVNPDEPFLAPGARFDLVSPRNSIASWIGAAAMEELERNIAFSSFYTGESALQRLSIIRELGYGSDEMNRRLSLVELRHGKSDS